jgi:hypothetical protein
MAGPRPSGFGRLTTFGAVGANPLAPTKIFNEFGPQLTVTVG